MFLRHPYGLSGDMSTPTKSVIQWCAKAIAGIAAFVTMLMPLQASAAGTWTKIVHPCPVTGSVFLLLTDGTVLAQAGYPSGGKNWYKLTPDANGSYQNGTWTQISSMEDTRLYFSSQVLPSGKMFVAGGEYGTGELTGEIYDPIADSWTHTAATTLNDIADANSILLGDGTILESNRGTHYAIYNPATDTWGSSLTCRNMNETDWVRLADHTILALVDYSSNSARYVPALGSWIDDATVPVSMFGFGAELGSAHLLPNGKVFWLGGTDNTAIYTPSGSTAPGSWVAGPKIPNSLGAVDAPAAMMNNGKILCVLGTDTDFGDEVFFYEYDYTTNQFTQVPDPNNSADLGDQIAPFVTSLLDLPDGSVLYQGSDSIYFYHPDGQPLAAGKPTIGSMTKNQDGSFHLTGTNFNGISQGAKYGDDKQMDSNYPIVRVTSNTTGKVYYMRTTNWTPGVMTGTAQVSTDFTLPANLPQDSYSLVVTVNGFSSDATTVALPIQASANFVQADTTTQGNWKTNYGADGYNVIGDTSGTNPVAPSYATVTPGAHNSGVWAASTFTANALEKINGADRIAGTWFQTSWSINVNDKDFANTHQIALYLLDYPNAGYGETITVTDALSGAVLDTRTATNFQGGVYYVWNILGNVNITLTSTAGHWAPLSGIFFGQGNGITPPPAPLNVKATPGNLQATLTWNASAGSTSYNVYRGTASGAESTAPIASGLTNLNYVDTGLNAGQTYYYEVVAVNGNGGSFPSAEVSVAIPSASVAFVRDDSTTQGNWKPLYGGDGYNVIGDSSGTSYPSYATVTPGAHTSGVWASSTFAPNCLQKVAGADRVAGVWYQTTWSIAVDQTGGAHQIALYTLDYPNAGYAETVTIKDTATGTVLDTRTESNFQGGVYHVWNVSGNVTFTLTSTAGHWAVLSGLFFGTGNGVALPAAPQNVKAVAGNQQATISWDAVPGATSYNLYRATSPGAETTTPLVAGITGTSRVNTGLTGGQTYYYKVIALNAGGVSPLSAEASTTIPASSASFVRDDATTQGNWKAVYGGDGYNVIGDPAVPSYPSYATVTPSTHNSGIWVASTLAQNCLDKVAPTSVDREAGVWYNTSWSLNVNVSGGAHQLALYTLDYPNAGYAETITIKDTATGTVLDTRSAANFQGGVYHVWSVSGNVTITMTSTAGHWAPISGIFFGPAPATKVPAAPTGVTASSGSLKATLNWAASSGATSYNIYRSTTAGGETPTALATGVTSTNYVDTGLTAGQAYYYKIIAVNAVGGSPTSAEVSATIPSASATFVNVDTGTQGSWKGVYGADGYNVIGDTSGVNPVYPSYATVTPGTHTAGIWAASTSNAAALQKVASGSTDRIAGVWFNTTWTTNVTVTGTHRLALYLLDYPNAGYAETITIKDAATGAVLDTQSAASFQNGAYYVWNVSGNLNITLTSTAGHWAPLSGIFFG